MSDFMSGRWLLLVLVSAFLLYGLAVDSELDLNGDSPRFVMLARSIHDGAGYVQRFYGFEQPETQIPYAYPALLFGVVATLGPEAWTGFKWVSVLSFVLAIWAAWFWLKSWIDPNDARLAVIVFAFLAYSQFSATRIATEAPFLAASFFCLGCMERILNQPEKRKWWLLFTVSQALAFHLRVAGFLLFPVLVLSALVRRQRRLVIPALGLGVIACLPWALRLLSFGFGYSEEFTTGTSGPGALLYRMVYNAAANVAKSLPDLLLYPFFTPFLPYEPLFFLKAAFGGGIALTMLFGLVKHSQELKNSQDFRQRLRASDLYVAIFMLFCLSWTVHGERYLLPVAPALIWLMLKGAARLRPPLAVAFLAIGIAGSVMGIANVWGGIRPPEEAGFIEAARWVGKNASQDARVLSRHPAWVFAVSNQAGLRWESSFDSEAHLKTIRENKITWVIADHHKVFTTTATEYLAELLAKHPDRFRLRYETVQQPVVRVYEVVPPEGP